jgi:hypothetical protein
LLVKTGGYIIKLKPQDILPEKIQKESVEVGKEIKEETIKEGVESTINKIKESN